MAVGKIFKRLLIISIWVFLIAISLYFPSLNVFPAQEKSINVFVWGGIILPEVLHEFEKKTGIKIHLSYYASNEELQVKMKATGGEEYDLIFPSGYNVQLLKQDGLLKPINWSKLDFKDQLKPALLNHAYDPGNVYSIPFEWEVYGLGYDERYFADHPYINSWKMLFDPSVVHYKIAMNNDATEAISLATFYLYGQAESLTQQQFQEVRQLLMMQRDWVEAYSDFRADYFVATGNCPIAFLSNPMAKRITQLFPHIGFTVPTEGSFASIENFCIPKPSKKEKYTYQLLNYLYSDESVISHCLEFGYFPAKNIPTDELNLASWELPFYSYTKEDFENLHFVKKLVPSIESRKLWVEVKSF